MAAIFTALHSKFRRECAYEQGKGGSSADALCADRRKNLQHAEALVREAAANGAQIILLPELWERSYFCQQRRYDFYQYALPTEENPAVQMGKRLAKELNIVLPISFLSVMSTNYIIPSPALMLTVRF